LGPGEVLFFLLILGLRGSRGSSWGLGSQGGFFFLLILGLRGSRRSSWGLGSQRGFFFLILGLRGSRGSSWGLGSERYFFLLILSFRGSRGSWWGLGSRGGFFFPPYPQIERVQGILVGPWASLKALFPPCRLSGSGSRGPTASAPRAGPQLQELHPQISQVIARRLPRGVSQRLGRWGGTSLRRRVWARAVWGLPGAAGMGKTPVGFKNRSRDGNESALAPKEK